MANKPPAAWITNLIRALLRHKDAARRLFLCCPLPDRKEFYQILRNLAKSRRPETINCSIYWETKGPCRILV